MNQLDRKERWRNPFEMERTSPLSNEAFRLAKTAIASSLVFERRGACGWPDGLLDDFLQPVVHSASATAKPAKQQRECTPSISARLFRAQDEERRRISRELHDSVGQSLTVILMNLEVLSRTVMDKTLEETIDLVKDVSREVRTISYLMHPPMLDLCGFETAINCYAEGFSKRSGIKTEVKVLVELPRLQTEKETALYRIAQECLTNVHRHSGASKAWIRIEVNEGQLRLEVEDNGKGFASKDVDASPHMPGSLGVGIPGMCERMRELGGSLHIHSSKQGTKVAAVLSLTETKEPGPPLGNTYDRRPEIAVRAGS